MKTLDFRKTAVLNGSKGLSDTEAAIFTKLSKQGLNPLMLDDLHNNPHRLALLATEGIKNVVLGTLTGETLEPLLTAFSKLNWLPENALITRGEDMFRLFEDKVNMFVLHPMNFNSDEIELTPFSEWF